MSFSESKTNMPEERIFRVGLTGTGAAVPTRRAGAGVTVTRTGVGVIRISFAKNPGKFVGVLGAVFSAATPSAVKGYTLTGGSYVAPAAGVKGYVEVSLWSSAFAAVDLAALQYVDLSIAFAAQSVIA